MLLFVYGSMMSNQEQHGILKDASFRFISKGYISGKLYDLGVGFPAATEEEGEIYGELYEVSDKTMKAVDELQGWYPNREAESLFIRKTVTVHSFSKQTYQAEVYYMSVDRLNDFFTVPLNGGRWS